jgi:hypothetical protein
MSAANAGDITQRIQERLIVSKSDDFGGQRWAVLAVHDRLGADGRWKSTGGHDGAERAHDAAGQGGRQNGG